MKIKIWIKYAVDLSTEWFCLANNNSLPMPVDIDWPANSHPSATPANVPSSFSFKTASYSFCSGFFLLHCSQNWQINPRLLIWQKCFIWRWLGGWHKKGNKKRETAEVAALSSRLRGIRHYRALIVAPSCAGALGGGS